MSALLAKAKAALAKTLGQTVKNTARGATDTAATAVLNKELGATKAAELTPIIDATGGSTSFLTSISSAASNVQLFFITYKTQLLYGLGITASVALFIYFMLIWLKIVPSPFPTTVTLTKQKTNAANVADSLNASVATAKVKVKEGFDSGASAAVDSQQYNMLNIQPMAIKQSQF